MVTSRHTFPFSVDPSDLFAERDIQMLGWGIPRSTVSAVRSKVREMWSDGPGGWTHEWVQVAQEAERRARWYEAAMCYGAAKFPSVSTAAQRAAYEKQLQCYLRASARFPCRFERVERQVPWFDGTTPVPVHLFSSRSATELTPLVCLTGG